jgi:hypothetical protein
LLYCRQMRSHLALVLAGLMLLVAACATPKGFTRPDPEAVQLGKSREADIRSRFGKPQDVTTQTIGGRPITSLSYTHAESPPDAAKVPVRVMVFMFADGVLVGHQYLSSFNDDTTDFDEVRAGRIARGQTTARQVVDLIGRPGGEFIHPLAKLKDGRAFVYNYSLTEKNAGSRRLTTSSKTLVVNFDTAGVVSDVDLSMTGK